MKARLIIAIVSTILEEVIIAVIALLGLPQLGVNVPIPALIAIMVVWGIVSTITFRIGTRILLKKPVAGLPDMIGITGKVVRVYGREGQVKIKNEIWDAKSLDDKIVIGEEVLVVGRDGLKLIVSRNIPKE